MSFMPSMSSLFSGSKDSAVNATAERKVLAASYGEARAAKLKQMTLPYRNGRIELHDGPEQPDAVAIGRKLASYATVMVPWAEVLFAPRVFVTTQSGERVEVEDATVIYQKEIREYSTLPQTVAYILISSRLSANEAFRALAAACWTILEAEADRAYSEPEAAALWSDKLTASLSGNQEIARRDAYADLPDAMRRVDAFVRLADVLADGGSYMPSAPHEQIFVHAFNGVLGRHLIAHLNPFE